MPLWVKISGTTVVQCWDVPPPEGDEGWYEAVEVRPPLTPNREVYGQQYFDISKTPVEIVWPVEAWSVDARKGTLRAWAQGEFQSVVSAQTRNEFNPDPNVVYDPTVVDKAKTLYRARIDAIEAAQTHEDLDAVT